MRARHRHFNPAHAGATLVLDARYIDQANASSVSSWPSRPRGSFTMAQATGVFQPKLQHAVIGGQNTVRFDGSDDRMQCSRVATTSNFSSIYVAKVAAQQNRIVLCQHAGTTDIGRTNFFSSSNTSPFEKGVLFFNNGSSYAAESTTSVINNSATLFCSESDGSGASHVRVKNGGKEGALTGQTWTPLNTNMTLGSFGNGSNAINGDISSVAFFPAQCSDAVRTRAHHAAAFSFKISCN